MTRKLRDPELDRLVQELNRRNAPEAEPEDKAPAPPAGSPPIPELLDLPGRARVEEGEPLDALLLELARQRASDLLLIAGMPPVFRVDGRLVRAQAEPLEGDGLSQMFKPHLGTRTRRDLDERGSADF